MPLAPCRPRMRTSFSKAQRRRPCEHEHAAEELLARLFRCALCSLLALICSCCDRGHVYCSHRCAQRARRQHRSEAGKRYQTTKTGRLNHAARQARHRERKKRLTAQPITPAPAGGVVAAVAVACQADHPEPAKLLARPVLAEAAGISRDQQIVTHHPSPPPPTDDVIPLDAAGTRLSRCDWCGRPCSRFVRLTFLRRRRRRSGGRRADDHPS